MNTLYQKNWLHPISLFILTILLPYGSYVFVTNKLDFTSFFVYVSFVAVFLLPFSLLPYKQIQFHTAENNKNGILEGILLIGLIVAFLIIRLLNHDSITYDELSSSTPSWLFWSSLLTWLSCYRLIEILSINKKVWWIVIPVISEIALLIIMGQRLWMVMFVLGLLAAIHVHIIKLDGKWFAAGVLGFILVIGPLMVISRYSMQQERPFVEVFQEELSDYPQKIGDTFERIGAKGLVLADLSKSLTDGNYHDKKRNPRELWQDVTTAIIPNILKSKKHNLRPGTEVYTTFVDKTNAAGKTYPSGLIGDIVWHFGWKAFFILPGISLMLIFLWNSLLAELCMRFGVNAIHFSYFFILYDTHFVFFMTSWTRALFVYGAFIILIKVLKKLDIIWAHQRI